ncbi:uncharacterized protein LOC128740410 [Sabethes cyaneus]|uniref:uncharacterized protein LOC128740410 n=1 Tax=Sabethes cyaneus TaxID=53552 RepID=UPI00237DF967|nr:uncharacterized protein LOC128740410 [Sabethes cyaneus]
MTEFTACDRCAKTIKKEEDLLRCMGFCDQVCHTRCAGLNVPFIKFVRSNNNLFWMCDECVRLMKFARFKSTVSSLGNVISSVVAGQMSGISELKDEIVRNNNEVAKLADKVNAATPMRIPARDRPAKRRRGDSETPNKPTTGTRVVDNPENLVVGTPPKLFWVYLSRFHPTVTSEVVERLVRDGLLNQEPVRVISLVKKGADLQSLNFISFKVGIPLAYKNAALNPDTWPQGIVFREFDDVRTNSAVWLPPTAPDPPATPLVGHNDNSGAGSSSVTPMVLTPVPLELPPTAAPSLTPAVEGP